MMKRMKKLVAMLLCVVMTAAFVPAFALGAGAAETRYTSVAGQTAEGIHALPKVITDGRAEIAFDIVLNTSSCNTLIGFNAAENMTANTYFANSTVKFVIYGSGIYALNGDTPWEGEDRTWRVAVLDVGKTYSVSVEIDMDNETWDAEMQTSDGDDLGTIIGFEFGNSASQIDSLVLVDNNTAGTVTITNLTVTLLGEGEKETEAETPSEEPTETPSEAKDYTVNSLDVSEISDGRFRASASVTKNSEREGTDVVVIALYDADGVMLTYIYMEAEFAVDQMVTFGGIVENAKGASVKAFVWDSLESMTPLS